MHAFPKEASRALYSAIKVLADSGKYITPWPSINFYLDQLDEYI
jgi:hypothetical protein